MGRIEEMGIWFNKMEKEIILNLDSEKYEKYKRVIKECKGKPPFSCLIWIDQDERTLEEIIKYAKEYKQQQKDMSEER